MVNIVTVDIFSLLSEHVNSNYVAPYCIQSVSCIPCTYLVKGEI